MYELQHAIHEVGRQTPHSPIVAVMHHYDFREYGGTDARMTLPEFSTLLAWIQSCPDVRVVTLGTLAGQHETRVWRAAALRSQLVSRMHWRLQSCFPRYCLMPESLWSYLRFPERPLPND